MINSAKKRRIIDANPVIEELERRLSCVSPGNPDEGFALEDALDLVEAQKDIQDIENESHWAIRGGVVFCWKCMQEALRYAGGDYCESSFCPACGKRMN